MGTLKHTAVVAILLALSACSPSKVELISEIAEVDANEIISSLYNIGIEGLKVKGKNSSSVMVDPEYMAKSVELLKAQGLPSQQHTTLGEIFKKEGMISTPLEEKARFIYALSQELERTLSQIDGVLIARVHLVLSEDNKIGRETQKPSAAVFVKHLPELDPDTISAKIKRIVSRSVPGLNEEGPESVSISFILSNLKSVEIKWVDSWGFRMTEKSANKLRSSVSLFLKLFALVIAIAGGVVIFYMIRIKGKRLAKAQG